MNNKTKSSRKGFTLVELLVVIGILAVLAAIAIPSVAGLIEKGNVSTDTQNATEMSNAIERWVGEYEVYAINLYNGMVIGIHNYYRIATLVNLDCNRIGRTVTANVKDLKIDHEFESIIPALADEEFKQLEENILTDGEVFNPIFTWNGFIIDGHHRYKILQKHPEIKYRIVEREFENRYGAIAWMCDQQLGRRNLTDRNRDYLIGQRYDYEVLSHGGDRRSEGKFSRDLRDPLKKEDRTHATRKRIAQEIGASEAYVERSRAFAKGVEAAEKVLPGIKKEILSETINPSKKQVAAIAKAPKEEQLKMTEALRTAEEERRKELQRKREERVAKRELSANIERLSAEHANINRPPVSIESHLESFTWTAERFLGTCDSFFEDAPELITNEKYRGGVMVTGEKFIQYFTKIKENRYEPYSV